MCAHTSRNISTATITVVAEERGLAGRDARAPERRDVDRAAVVAEEAVAAVGEVRRGQHDRDRAGEHQRDQRQVQAAEAQGRQSDQRSQHHRDQARAEQHERVRQRGREQDPRGDPRAEREHRRLAERDHADAPDQQPEAERDDRVDRHLGGRVDVVRAEQRRQGEQHEQEQDRATPGCTIARGSTLRIERAGAAETVRCAALSAPAPWSRRSSTPVGSSPTPPAGRP